MRMFFWSVAVLVLGCSTAFSATQAEICSQLEDFALGAIRAKTAGSSEVALRSQISVQAGGILDKLIAMAFWSDGVTEEYMVANARLECSVMFLFDKDDGSRVDPATKVDPTLMPNAWINACTKAKWFEFNLKLKGAGTLINMWDKHNQEVSVVSDALWAKKDRINSGEYGPKDLLQEIVVQGWTSFQDSISGQVMSCVMSRIRLEAK